MSQGKATDSSTDFDSFDCAETGEPYRQWRRKLLRFTAGKTDESGSSYADHLLDVDMGGAGAGATPMPGGTSREKMVRLRAGRRKGTYATITKHLTDEVTLRILSDPPFFQDGPATLAYLDAIFDTPLLLTDLRRMGRQYDELSIPMDVGVCHDSIILFVKVLQRANGDFPAANRKTQNEITEKLLECIADTSKHFSEQATKEYNAPVGSREYEVAAGPNAGQRDLYACAAYYNQQWRLAVEKGWVTKQAAQRRAPIPPPRHSVDAGMSVREVANSVRTADHPTQAPRSVSPSHTLYRLAEAGLDVRRDTVTTSDFEEVGLRDLCMAVSEGESNDFSLETCFDADDQSTVEMACFNCRGLGHRGRVCPSPKKFRTFSFAIAMLTSAMKRAEEGASASGAPQGGRRPPPRGMRPPFRDQPRRFQPRRVQFGRRPMPPPRPRSDSASAADEHNYTTDERGDDAEEQVVQTVADDTAVQQPLRFNIEGDLFEDELVRSVTETNATDMAHISTNMDGHTPEGQKPWVSVAVVGVIFAAFLALSSLLVITAVSAAGSFANARSAVESAVHAACTTVAQGFELASAIIVQPKWTGVIIIFTMLLTQVGGAAPKEVEVALNVRAGTGTTRHVRCDATWHRVLVVDGLAPDTILLAVRKMKALDNILVYFNSDNSYGVDDCLRLPCGTFVPFIPSTHAYEVLAPPQKAFNDPTSIDTDLHEGSSIGVINTPELRLTIDSGATSTCIPKELAHLITLVTDAKPNIRVRVASGVAHRVIQVGNMTLKGLNGFTFDGKPAPRALSEKLRIHAALCHAGRTRVSNSDITYQGAYVAGLRDTSACPGCRLGGGKQPATSTGRSPIRLAEPYAPLSYYGQLVETDTSYPFPRSFPHGFTALQNFCDAWSGERVFAFLLRVDSREVASALRAYVGNRGQIGIWRVDNGNEFKGTEVEAAVASLVKGREFSIPNVKNSNPRPERSFGVVQHAVRCCLAYADAPGCLWPWAVHQYQLVSHYLATRAHDPPQSAYSFLNPSAGTIELGWARVLFCDVTVALPVTDYDGKLSERAADGVFLGYDERRRGHFVYVPSVKRLSTFYVSHWRENSFTLCKLLSADTPVEYHSVDDLLAPPATLKRLPTHMRNPRPSPSPPATHPLLPPPRHLPPILPPTPHVPPLPAAAVNDSLCQEGDLTEMAKAVAVARTTEQSIADDTMAQVIDLMSTAEVNLDWEPDLGIGNLPKEVAFAMRPAVNLPDTIEKARANPRIWPLVKDALEAEITGKFIGNKAWQVVKREDWMHVIKSKWVLKYTLAADGSIEKVKARLVACGYMQRPGSEYTEVFAKTLATFCLRIFFALVALWNLETDHIDAYKAFTQANVDANIFVEMAEGFRLEGYVMQLKQALEGIKQGAYLWFNLNKKVLNKIGYRETIIEPTFYKHTRIKSIIGVHADDIGGGYRIEDEAAYLEIRRQYALGIKVGSGTVVPISIFTGVEVCRNRQAKTLTIRQTKYIEQLAKKYEGQFELRRTPARAEFEKLTPAPEAERISVTDYLKLLCSLLWPANVTRPDALFHVCFLCTFNSSPGKKHFQAALDILGYLVATKEMGITYGGKLQIPSGLSEFPPSFVESGGLHTFTDSSFGKRVKPFGGFCVMYNNGPVSVAARTVKIVPDSVSEAEMAMASKGSKETLAARMVLADVDAGVKGPSPILIDCKATRDIIVNPGCTAKTRHFERATLLVKRLYSLLITTPYLIATEFMIADILTKMLADMNQFFKLRDILLNHKNSASNVTIVDTKGNEVALEGKAARLWNKLVSCVRSA